MHEMRAIATDDPLTWCIVSSLSVTRLRPAKMAEQIEVLFRVKTWGPDPPTARENGEWRKCLPIVQNKPPTFPTHSLDGITFDAAFFRLL